MTLVIINPVDETYFSMLGSDHFTHNKDIAQRFETVEDAQACTEQNIDSNEGFKAFGMIFTEIIPFDL